jgi:enoyl-CoA hydratase
VSTPQLEISITGRLGTVALNRPQAINALSLEMIEGITAQLLAWRNDPGVRVVLFEGRGPKGFCAGGDVRYVRERLVAGDFAGATAYFAAEYRMDGLIATYPKPVISLTEGIVMGGGIGVAGHAAFRFTTPSARYAMPEAAIGFVSDIGVNWILARAPAQRALMFLMSGLPVSGADVLALGLADCAVPPERFDYLRSSLAEAARAPDIEPAIVAIMQSESIQAGERELCTLADRFADAFELQTAGDIVEALAEDAESDPDLAPVVSALQSRSPTSLEAIVMSHRAARLLPDAGSVLDLDLAMAGVVARAADFAEGVRAQLIDKDMKPRWNPATFAAVDRAALEAAVATVARPLTPAQG